MLRAESTLIKPFNTKIIVVNMSGILLYPINYSGKEVERRRVYIPSS